jgi:hypothetical protein
MNIQECRDIMDVFHLPEDENTLNAIKYATDIAVHQTRARYNCEHCKEKTILEFLQKLHALLHVKGWDE